MENSTDALFSRMIEYYSGDPGQIQHFMKVYLFARLIAQGEKVSNEMMRILEVAAIVHDIGIKPAIAKYGSAAGPYQEELGMPEAETMLKALGFDEKLIDRVVYLVGHHHTYSSIDGMDYQILVEADFLVNMYEGNMDKKAMKNAFEKYFVTGTGRKIASQMFEI